VSRSTGSNHADGIANTVRLSNDMVKLVVGKGRKDFLVHRTAIAKASPVLQAAFRSNTWKEGRARTMVLPDDDPETIQMLLHFAYVGRLPNLNTDDDYSSIGNDHRGQYDGLARLYCVGEKYQNKDFKNATIDAMLSKVAIRDNEGSRWFPSSPAIKIIYNGTPEGSKARKLMVDIYVYGVGAANIVAYTLHLDFIKDLIAALTKILLDGEIPFFREERLWIPSCEYHEHASGECCGSGERLTKDIRGRTPL